MYDYTLTTPVVNSQLKVNGFDVIWYPSRRGFYVEAFDGEGCVLAVDWNTKGEGDAILDRVSDEIHSAIFETVLSHFIVWSK
jgi:hypothetical protein